MCPKGMCSAPRKRRAGDRTPGCVWLVLAALVALVYLLTGCTAPNAYENPQADPCWSDEYQRVLPPVLGTDC